MEGERLVNLLCSVLLRIRGLLCKEGLIEVRYWHCSIRDVVGLEGELGIGLWELVLACSGLTTKEKDGRTSRLHGRT